MIEFTALLSLLVAAFTSATIWPGSSEMILILLLNAGHAEWPLFFVATIGNIGGGITTYILGIGLQHILHHRTLSGLLQRYGAILLVFSWVPIVGDLLCLMAGWLRLNFLFCVLAMSAGKAIRYWWIIWLYQYFKN